MSNRIQAKQLCHEHIGSWLNGYGRIFAITACHGVAVEYSINGFEYTENFDPDDLVAIHQ